MRDVLVVTGVIAFFVLGAAYIALCARILADAGDIDEPIAESRTPTRPRPRPTDTRPTPTYGGSMSADNVIALVLAVLLDRLPRGGPALPRAVLDDRCRLAPARRARVALAVDRPFLGRYLAGSSAAAPPPATGCSAPSSALIYRLCGVDPEREQRWTTYAISLLAFSVVSVLVLYALQRLQGSLPFNPTGVDGGAAGPVVQHRGQLRHQHELAELRRRDDDEPPHPDGGPGGAELRVGRRRPGRRRRPDPGPGPPARSTTIGNFWVDLVRGVDPGPAARSPSSSPSCWSARA